MEAGPVAGPPKKITNFPDSQRDHGPETVRKLRIDPHFFQLASALLIGMASMNRDEPIDVYDLRNAIVPFSLLDIRHRFKKMQPGDSLVVLWSDSAAADDLLRVLPASSFEIVSKGEISGQSAGFRMELVKTRMGSISLPGNSLFHK